MTSLSILILILKENSDWHETDSYFRKFRRILLNSRRSISVGISDLMQQGTLRTGRQ